MYIINFVNIMNIGDAYIVRLFKNYFKSKFTKIQHLEVNISYILKLYIIRMCTYNGHCFIAYLVQEGGRVNSKSRKQKTFVYKSNSQMYLCRNVNSNI